MAQFIYLLLHNDGVRKVIDTVTSRVVLILGRFTPERKAVLDAVQEELRKRDYLPVVFDFEKPSNRDLTETVSTLAHMAKFMIADLTDPRSLPQELATIVPHLRSVPAQPISSRLSGNGACTPISQRTRGFCRSYLMKRQTTCWRTSPNG